LQAVQAMMHWTRVADLSRGGKLAAVPSGSLLKSGKS